MSTKTTECKNCGNRYKIISKEGLCYACYLRKYGKIAEEWQPKGKYKQ